MTSCGECRWWTTDWDGASPGEGACMISRTEVAADGVCRPVVRSTHVRAMSDTGLVAAVLVTSHRFACAQFTPR